MAELLNKRTYNQKCWDNEDGTFRYKIHQRHIHYKNGLAFEDIDTRMSKENGRFKQSKASFHSELPEYADGEFWFRNQYEGADHYIKAKPVAEHVQGVLHNEEKDGNYVLYENAFGTGIDLKAYAYHHGIKKVIVIKEKPSTAEDLIFDFEITNVAELIAALPDDTLVDLKNNYDLKSKTLKLGSVGGGMSYMRDARMWDSSHNKNVSVDIQLYKKGNKIFIRKIVPWEFLDANDTVYPVMTDHPTTYYSGAGDGAVWTSGKSTFSDARDATTTDAGNVNYTATNAQSRSEYIFAYHIQRIFLPFDTSGIDDSHDVTAGTLKLYRIYDNDTWSNTTYDYSIVTEGSQASTSELVADDYDNVSFVAGSDEVHIADGSTEAYDTFTLNATGRGWISVTGYTKLAVISGYDFDDVDFGSSPSVAWLTMQYSMSEETGTSEDPYLDLTTAAGGGSSPSSSPSSSLSASSSPSASPSTSPSTSISASPSTSPSSSPSTSPSASPSASPSTSPSSSPSASPSGEVSSPSSSPSTSPSASPSVSPSASPSASPSPSPSSADGTWLAGYGYRKRIRISGQSGAGNDYQVKLLVGASSSASGEDFDLGGNASSFPTDRDISGDIRFTDNDGETLLDFWVHKVTGTGASALAQLWVKVDDSLDTDQYIFCYYGGSSTNVSSIEDTFVRSCDFNTNGVQSYGGAAQDVDSTQYTTTENDGYTLRMWGNNWKAYTISSFSYNNNYEMLYDFKDNGTEGEIHGIGTDTQRADVPIDPTTRFWQVWGTQLWGTESGTQYTDSNAYEEISNVLSTNKSNQIYLFFGNDADASQATDIYYKDVRIKKWVSTEPAYESVDSEEVNPNSPSASPSASPSTSPSTSVSSSPSTSPSSSPSTSPSTSISSSPSTSPSASPSGEGSSPSTSPSSSPSASPSTSPSSSPSVSPSESPSSSPSTSISASPSTSPSTSISSSPSTSPSSSPSTSPSSSPSSSPSTSPSSSPSTSPSTSPSSSPSTSPSSSPSTSPSTSPSSSLSASPSTSPSTSPSSSVSSSPSASPSTSPSASQSSSPSTSPSSSPSGAAAPNNTYIVYQNNRLEFWVDGVEVVRMNTDGSIDGNGVFNDNAF